MTTTTDAIIFGALWRGGEVIVIRTCEYAHQIPCPASSATPPLHTHTHNTKLTVVLRHMVTILDGTTALDSSRGWSSWLCPGKLSYARRYHLPCALLQPWTELIFWARLYKGSQHKLFKHKGEHINMQQVLHGARQHPVACTKDPSLAGQQNVHPELRKFWAADKKALTACWDGQTNILVLSACMPTVSVS